MDCCDDELYIRLCDVHLLLYAHVLAANSIISDHSHCPTSTPTTTLQPTTTSTDGTTSSTGNATSSTEAKSHKGYTESQKIELGIGISFGSFMAILGVWKCIKRSCS
jgi:hypothetical protein